jgi:hypothetical protein
LSPQEQGLESPAAEAAIPRSKERLAALSLIQRQCNLAINPYNSGMGEGTVAQTADLSQVRYWGRCRAAMVTCTALNILTAARRRAGKLWRLHLALALYHPPRHSHWQATGVVPAPVLALCIRFHVVFCRTRCTLLLHKGLPGHNAAAAHDMA